MIEYEFDRNTLRQVEKKLGNMKSEAPKALKNAINATAKQARKDLAAKAQSSYTVKSGGFNKAMKIRNATTGNLEAVISTTGEPIPLKNFKVSITKRGARAQVVKPGSLKDLNKGGIKAFRNNIAKKGQTRKRDTKKGKAGTAVRHLAVAQRQGRERLHIKELYSNSIPAMIGSEERVYGIVEPTIQSNLQDNIEKQVKKILNS